MSALAELYREIENCQDCGLAKCRIRVVPGEGAENAELFFIGEAPVGMKINKVALSSDRQDNSWSNC